MHAKSVSSKPPKISDQGSIRGAQISPSLDLNCVGTSTNITSNYGTNKLVQPIGSLSEAPLSTANYLTQDPNSEFKLDRVGNKHHVLNLPGSR